MTDLRIQKNDQLAIQVYSQSTLPSVDALYNLPSAGSSNTAPGELSAPTTPSAGGFLVDSKGNIQYPRLGVFHAEGLTKEELSEQIRKRLVEPVELLKDPTVIVRFLNLKITVTGEVKIPGLKVIPSERVTILEAIGLAGDVTDFGMKNSVKVVREIDGKRQIGIVDLSSKDVFQSPFYYLVQNDLVVVDPSRKKSKKTDQDMVIQRVSFGLSVITAVALVYNILK
jgi:polysaccharide biosynthesis/export protein